MNRYIIIYAIDGGIAIDADTEAEAIEKFNAYTKLELCENAPPAEITEIFVDDSD